MSDLEKALESIGPLIAGGYGCVVTEDDPIIDAARKWASLTSPETIEKAAMKLYDLEGEGRFTDATWNPSWESEDEGVKEEYRAAAEAVLRAVEQDHV